MEDTLLTLEILIKSLEQKKTLLNDIKDYTKRQSQLLLEEELDYDLFNNIIENKQVRIDNILALDEGFIPTYKRISEGVNANKALYKEQISQMKKLIVEINDVQVAISMGEERNKKMFSDKMAMIKNGAKAYRNHNDAYKKYQGIDQGGVNDELSLFDSKK